MDGTKASVTPQHCKAGQTFAAIPTNNAGTKIGAMLNVTLKGKVFTVAKNCINIMTQWCKLSYI